MQATIDHIQLINSNIFINLNILLTYYMGYQFPHAPGRKTTKTLMTSLTSTSKVMLSANIAHPPSGRCAKGPIWIHQ